MKKMEQIYQTVVKELVRLNLAMPIQVEDKTLKAKARIFAEELAFWKPETIAMAIREYMRHSRYFPTPAEIRDRCKAVSVALEYKGNVAGLPAPESLSDEQLRINRDGIKQVRDRIAKSTVIAD